MTLHVILLFSRIPDILVLWENISELDRNWNCLVYN